MIRIFNHFFAEYTTAFYGKIDAEGDGEMIRILDCKGAPVVCLKDEGRLGFVGDALYDSENNVKGFMLEGENGFTGRFFKKFIALDDILKLSRDVCVVYSESSVKKFSKKCDLTPKNGLEEIMGRSVVSKSGEKLGVVHDMVFDMETGTLEGLELSKGFMNDMIEGRKVIFMRDGVEFGKEYIIARSEENDEK